MPDGYEDVAREALMAKAREAWQDDPALDPQVDELPRREGLAGGWRCWPMRVS